MAQADSVTTLILPAPASDVPTTYAVGANGWMPVIDHSTLRPAYVRFERFPRNVKATAEEATEYARRTIAWRKHFAGFKRRKLEATAHPRWLRYFSQAAE